MFEDGNGNAYHGRDDRMTGRDRDIGIHPTMIGTDRLEPLAAHQTRAARRIELCRDDLSVALGWLEGADSDAADELGSLMRQLHARSYRLDKSDDGR